MMVSPESGYPGSAPVRVSHPTLGIVHLPVGGGIPHTVKREPNGQQHAPEEGGGLLMRKLKVLAGRRSIGGPHHSRGIMCAAAAGDKVKPR